MSLPVYLRRLRGIRIYFCQGLVKRLRHFRFRFLTNQMELNKHSLFVIKMVPDLDIHFILHIERNERSSQKEREVHGGRKVKESGFQCLRVVSSSNFLVCMCWFQTPYSIMYIERLGVSWKKKIRGTRILCGEGEIYPQRKMVISIFIM